MRKRAALINNLNRLKSYFELEFEGIDIECVEIYIDVEQRKERMEIVKILRSCKKRLPLIILLMLKNKRDDDHYGAEPYNTYAMKFKNGKVNPRIYCLEFTGPGIKKKIVLVYGVPHKPSTKLSKSEKTRLESIKDYEYEFFKNPKHAIEHRKQ